MQAVRQIFSNFFRAEKPPGLVVAVVKRGEVIDFHSWGRADTSGRGRLGPETQFRIASMSKSFAAAAVLQLRDRQCFSLEQRVGEILKGVPLAAFWREATIRKLLAMDLNLPLYDDPLVDRALGADDQQYLELFAKEPTQDPERFSVGRYSNHAYALLGLLVARTSGTSMHRYVLEQIIRPLGLRRTLWNPLPRERNVALGFERRGTRLQEIEMAVSRGFGDAFAGLWSTAQDLARWTHFFCSVEGEEKVFDRVLSYRSRLEMQHGATPFRNTVVRVPGERGSALASGAYGMGLVQSCFEGNMYVTHSGGLPGYGSNMRWHRATGLAIVAMGNSTYCPVAAPASAALALVVRAATPKPSVTPLVVRASKTLLRLVKEWNQDTANRLFSSNIALDHDIGELEDLFSEARSILGTKFRVELLPKVGVSARLRLRRPAVRAQSAVGATMDFLLSAEAGCRVQEISLRLLPPADGLSQKIETWVQRAILDGVMPSRKGPSLSRADGEFLLSCSRSVGDSLDLEVIERNKDRSFTLEVRGPIAKCEIYFKLSEARRKLSISKIR